MPEKHYWFRKRPPEQGWGLGPGSREGWIATVIFLIVDAGGVAILIPLVADTHWWLLIAWAFGWLAAFLVLVFAMSEPLR